MQLVSTFARGFEGKRGRSRRQIPLSLASCNVEGGLREHVVRQAEELRYLNIDRALVGKLVRHLHRGAAARLDFGHIRTVVDSIRDDGIVELHAILEALRVDC